MPLGNLLDNPAFMLGMNLLANNQWSSTPQSLAGNVGQAMQQTMQQAMMNEQLAQRREYQKAEMQKQQLLLKKAQIDMDAEMKSQDAFDKYLSGLKGGQASAMPGSPGLGGTTITGAQPMASGLGGIDPNLLEAIKADPQARRQLMGMALKATMPATPELPSNVQSALFASGGDLNRARQIIEQNMTKPQTTINNIPAPPTGYFYRTAGDPSTLAPIPNFVPTETLNKFSDLRRQFNSADSILNEYKKTIEETGPETIGSIVGTEASTKAKASFAKAQMALKNLFQLGALVGRDFSILDTAITNPTDWGALKIGKSGLLEQINQAQQFLANERGAIDKELKTMRENRTGQEGSTTSADSGMPPGAISGKPPWLP